MGKRKQLVLINREGDDPNSDRPLGSVEDVTHHLAKFNTAVDGAPEKEGGYTRRLFGPGMYVDVPIGNAIVNQVLIDCYDPDLAAPVLIRLCRSAGWRMQDVETGQMFG
ncbi:MAG: hypothetical protein AAGI17_00445 [Planctomycetota bacterium]